MQSDMLGAAEVESVSCALFTMGCVSDVSIWVSSEEAAVALHPPKAEVLPIGQTGTSQSHLKRDWHPTHQSL